MVFYKQLLGNILEWNLCHPVAKEELFLSPFHPRIRQPRERSEVEPDVLLPVVRHVEALEEDDDLVLHADDLQVARARPVYDEEGGRGHPAAPHYVLLEEIVLGFVLLEENSPLRCQTY